MAGNQSAYTGPLRAVGRRGWVPSSRFATHDKGFFVSNSLAASSASLLHSSDLNWVVHPIDMEEVPSATADGDIEAGARHDRPFSTEYGSPKVVGNVYLYGPCWSWT